MTRSGYVFGLEGNHLFHSKINQNYDQFFNKYNPLLDRVLNYNESQLLFFTDKGVGRVLCINNYGRLKGKPCGLYDGHIIAMSNSMEGIITRQLQQM